MNAKKCAKRGHPIVGGIAGSGGPLTRWCACDHVHETICAQCGTPWSTADGHDQTCFMWQAMHAPTGSEAGDRLGRMSLGEE